MPSIQNAFRLFEPIESAPSTSRLSGTPWANVLVARSFYRGIESLARILGRLGVSANAITYASLVVALGAGAAIGFGHASLAAALVLLSGCLDLVDGAVARITGSTSRWGALLDSTLDRIADAAPLTGVVVFYAQAASPWPAVAPLVAIVAGFVISYVRARAEALGYQLPSSFMRRAERVLLVAASLMLGAVSLPGSVRAPLMLAGVGLNAILNVIGAVGILGAAHAAMRLDEPSANHASE